MKVIKWMLFPFAILYQVITDFRNHLFNIDHFKSFEFEANVISVGNLTVGGTGKTPMVEYLINLLLTNYRLATLSRGYGRKTKGFLKAEPKHSTTDIADEPMQYFLKFGDQVSVTVGEERAWAIPSILMDDPETDVILLDDAYQHRTVVPSLSILLTTYSNPFFSDYLMPTGLLRESRKGARRADIVVVTKCPDTLEESEAEMFRERIGNYSTANVFFTRMAYGKPVHYFDNNLELKGIKLLIVSGIAKSDHFERFTSNEFEVIKHLKYGDHHRFNSKDVSRIQAVMKDSGAQGILTTEKDFTKLREFQDEWRDLPIFYLPIQTEFLYNKEAFDELVIRSIKKYNREGEHWGEA